MCRNSFVQSFRNVFISTWIILLVSAFSFSIQDMIFMEQNTFKRVWKCDQNVTNFGSTSLTLVRKETSKLRCASLCSQDQSCVVFLMCVNSTAKFCYLLASTLTQPCGVNTLSANSCSYYVKLKVTENEPSTTTITSATTTTANPCQNQGIWNGATCVCPKGCTGTTCETCYIDCYEGTVAGETGEDFAYIKPTGCPLAFQVTCNFNYGVTYVQYRRHGNVSFDRDWASYKEGFGDVRGDYWVGNDKIHAITSQRTVKLGAVVKANGILTSQNYHNFKVDSEANEYKLTYTTTTSPSGLSPGDASKTAYNQPFRTRDRDTTGCAITHASGWWYNTGCSLANANAAFPFDWYPYSSVTMVRLGLYP